MNGMNESRNFAWLPLLLLGAFAAGCGGENNGRDPVLGFDAGFVGQAPTVIAVVPAHATTGVAINNTVITAAFSEPMNPLTGGASFTVTCASPCTSPVGSVALDATGTIATFTLDAGTPLEPQTQYTGTITGATSLATGISIVQPFVWNFTTGNAPDTTRPRVTVTVPATSSPGPTTGVSPDTVISAEFTEDMAPTTISGTSFTVTCAAPCTSPTGTVTYSVTGRTAVFTPDAPLEHGGTYTATVTDDATDLAGNRLAGNQASLPAASDYVWRFRTPARPAVTAVVPANGAAGVPINNTVITAEFTEPMNPLTGGASFTVTCGDPCTNPPGSVALNDSGTIATFTLDSGTTLETDTTYTGTITGATSAGTGLAIASPFVWSFKTGVTPDVTRPRVEITVPATSSPGPTTNVPSNTAITATFTESMAPATINGTSFTVTCADPCVSPAGSVFYSVASRTAVFDPDSALEDSTTYTATITDDATDLAGNQLAGNQAALPAASDYIWTFTTSTPTVTPADPPQPVAVLSTEPSNGATICPDDSINATFDVPSGLRMNPKTVNSVTFSISGPGGAAVLANSVSLDVSTGTIATFEPLNDLTPGDTYTAVIKGGTDGVKDLAVPANQMELDVTWTFEVGPATNACLQPIALNAAAPFGMISGTAGKTNTGIQTIINGDLGSTTTTTSSLTGFHDENGDVYTETTANIGAVNGVIYSCTVSTTGPTTAVNASNCNKASVARLQAEAAYLEMKGLPGGPDPSNVSSNLASLTLAPGVYTTANNAFFIIQGGDLTLDAQGDANAVWVFQIESSLTVGGPGAAAPVNIILTGSAQPKNVFWQVGSDAIINAAGGGTMVGTIIADQSIAFSTAGNTNIVTLNGRVMSLNASTTLVDTVINVPNP